MYQFHRTMVVPYFTTIPPHDNKDSLVVQTNDYHSLSPPVRRKTDGHMGQPAHTMSEKADVTILTPKHACRQSEQLVHYHTTILPLSGS